jgi:hypothetical protein
MKDVGLEVRNCPLIANILLVVATQLSYPGSPSSVLPPQQAKVTETFAGGEHRNKVTLQSLYIGIHAASAWIRQMR